MKIVKVVVTLGCEHFGSMIIGAVLGGSITVAAVICERTFKMV